MQRLIPPTTCQHTLARLSELPSSDASQLDAASLIRRFAPLYLTLHAALSTNVAAPQSLITRWQQAAPIPYPRLTPPDPPPQLAPNETLLTVWLDGPLAGTASTSIPEPPTSSPAHLPILLTLTPTHLLLSA